MACIVIRGSGISFEYGYLTQKDFTKLTRTGIESDSIYDFFDKGYCTGGVLNGSCDLLINDVVKKTYDLPVSNDSASSPFSHFPKSSKYVLVRESAEEGDWYALESEDFDESLLEVELWRIETQKGTITNLLDISYDGDFMEHGNTTTYSEDVYILDNSGNRFEITIN